MTHDDFLSLQPVVTGIYTASRYCLLVLLTVLGAVMFLGYQSGRRK